MTLADSTVVPVGVLLVERNVTPNVDRSVGRFRYAASYLKRADAVPLDPIQLPLEEGEFRFARMGGLPSAIRDASPDNWGRTLIQRKFFAQGLDQPLAEVDYLIHSPADRSGNLHFAVDFRSDGTPDWDKKALRPEALPAMAALKEHVLTVLKNPQGTHGRAYPQEMDALLTGSGGARPKVNIRAPGGTHLVKLANPLEDKASNARLEEASIRMAAQVGIETASVVARRDAEQDFLTVKRFDVTPDGRRLQMVSAMTVLNASDDPYNRTNWSYPLFARELDRWSSNPAVDKEALFRSMVLRAMLSDADDHPRNYSLIRDPSSAENSRGGSTLGQWRLAPLYDCVVGMGRGFRAPELAMTIGTFGHEISEENILSECDAFGLSDARAREIVREIEAKVLVDFPAVLENSNVDEASMAVAMRSIARLDDRPHEGAIQRLMRQMERPPDEGGANAQRERERGA